MDSSLWDELADYFDQALEMSASERHAFLQRIKEQDETVWQELASLLQFSESADSYFGEVKELMPGEPEEAAVNLDPYNFVGTRIGQYQIIDTLGIGGMGVVYRGRDVELQRIVALKFLPPTLGQDQNARVRFYAEARAASRLDHQNVCTIHEIGSTKNGLIYIVMAYYEGETLQEKLEKEELTHEHTLDYIRQIAQGLQAAHQQNIIHRDIKPGNVMITSKGVVKILDFGLAKVADQNLTKTGMTMGTVAYMSPELIRGKKPVPASDIWSLGVMLYEMTTGLRPFRGGLQEAIMYRIVNEEPDFKILDTSQSRPLLTEITKRCLQKETEHRYENTALFLGDLEQLVPDSPGVLSKPLTDKRPSGLNKIFIAGAIIAAVFFAWISVPINVSSSTDADRRIALLPFRAVEESAEDQVMAQNAMYMIAYLLVLLDSPDNPISVIPLSEVLNNKVDTPESAYKRLGANTVVEGELNRLRDVIALSLNITDPRDNRFIGDNVSLLDSGSDVDMFTRSFQRELFGELAGMLEVTVTDAMTQAFLDAQPEDPDALAFYLQGIAYLNQRYRDNFYEYAIQQFTQSLDEDSLFARSHAGLCEALFEKYTYTFDASYVDQARGSCERAAELGSNQSAVLTSLGRIYFQTGNSEQAKQLLRRALSVDPENAEAFFWMGRIHDTNLEVDSAIASYSHAISIKSNNWSYYLYLGVLYASQGRLDEAVAQYENVKKLTPDNLLALSNLGIIQVQKGDTEDAKSIFKDILALDTQSIYAHRMLGMLLLTENNIQEAIDTLQLPSQAGDLVSLDLMGQAHLVAGSPEAAEASWRDLIQRTGIRLQVDSTNTYMAIMNAAGYGAIGVLDSSLASLELIGEEHRIDMISYLSGRIYEQNGEREKALSYIERAFIDHYNVSLIESDPFLVELRETDEYKGLLERFNSEE